MENQLQNIQQLLDKYLCPTFRQNIEESYYEKINTKARLSEALKDAMFRSHPLQHSSLFTDHGVVHVRDVATRLLLLLDKINGIHFPKRDAARLDFMKGYGAMLAYVHDIGMLTVNSPQHELHSQKAAQIIYSDAFDKQLTLLWEENSGNVAWRITRLAFKKLLNQPPRHVLREMLALCSAHERQTVPTDLLNHPAELRSAIQKILAYDLHYQWLEQQLAVAEKRLAAASHLDAKQQEYFVTQKIRAEEALNTALAKKQTSAELNAFLKLFYKDFWQESFLWLVSDNTEIRELVDDVIDTLRTLRCANASRQRGTRLRATGHHQIFLDNRSGNAIYAINANQKIFLLESKNTLLSGEVNLSSTEFTPTGDLRISFYCGHFANEGATEHAIFNAAIAINEVQEDMIGSFSRATAGAENTSADYAKKWQPVYLLLEDCEDNPHFAEEVQKQLILLNPGLKNTIRIVPSLQKASEQERNRYLSSVDLGWDLKTQLDILEKIASSGHKTAHIHPPLAFTDVKCASLKAGEILMQAGSEASFVYIPLTEGLIGYPLGGYEPFHAEPFIPLGNVSVIRHDVRNATVVAEKPVTILMIPGEVYLHHWHNTYTEEDFIQVLNQHNFMAEKAAE